MLQSNPVKQLYNMTCRKTLHMLVNGTKNAIIRCILLSSLRCSARLLRCQCFCIWNTLSAPSVCSVGIL